MEEEKIDFEKMKRVPLASERAEIRSRRRKRFLVFLLCLLSLMAGIFADRVYTLANPVQKKESNIYEQIKSIMGHTWLYSDLYEDLDKELEDKALYGMTAFDFDPYTTYMSDEEMNSFTDSINGNYVGIGVEYTNFNGKAMIVKVFYSSPAEKAGLQAGDAILKVDGIDIVDADTEQIRSLVLGIEGTEVVLTIERGTEVFDVTVIRGVVNSTVFAYKKDDLIVMELNSFGSTTCEECIKYLDNFAGAGKIIVDLRGNGGGYQGSVRDICGLFIGPDEVYLRQRGVDGKETSDYTPSDSKHYDFDKIVLLVNGDTASAAEVFTIAVKERCENVTIIGEKTFGKGVIQTNRVLNNGGVLKLTSYYWYSPDGVSIHEEGIAPDIEVKMPDIYYESYYDLEEDEAYEFDSVSDSAKVTQKALQYLGYDIERTDGYFDASLRDALISYQAEHSLKADGILDQTTFSSIISETSRELSINDEKDTQLQKALEVVRSE